MVNDNQRSDRLNPFLSPGSLGNGAVGIKIEKYSTQMDEWFCHSLFV
jgi:hypothetical protein